MMELADAKRSKPKRIITRDGKPFKVADDSPLAIARAIKNSPAAGSREAKLREAEKKLGIR